MAPTSCGNCHLDSNSSPICSQCWFELGVCRYSFLNKLYRPSHTSGMIFEIDETVMRKLYMRSWYEQPDAKSLKVTHKRSWTVMASLMTVFFFSIRVSFSQSSWNRTESILKIRRKYDNLITIEDSSGSPGGCILCVAYKNVVESRATAQQSLCSTLLIAKTQRVHSKLKQNF